MNRVKLLHIKCCFFQYFNSPVALNFFLKIWPPKKKLKWRPCPLQPNSAAVCRFPPWNVLFWKHLAWPESCFRSQTNQHIPYIIQQIIEHYVIGVSMESMPCSFVSRRIVRGAKLGCYLLQVGEIWNSCVKFEICVCWLCLLKSCFQKLYRKMLLWWYYPNQFPQMHLNIWYELAWSSVLCLNSPGFWKTSQKSGITPVFPSDIDSDLV